MSSSAALVIPLLLIGVSAVKIAEAQNRKRENILYSKKGLKPSIPLSRRRRDACASRRRVGLLIQAADMVFPGRLYLQV